MSDKKQLYFLTDDEINIIKEIDKEISHLVDSDSDGDMYRMMRLSNRQSNIIESAKQRKSLEDRKISYKEIPGGFIVQSPKISYRKYYYYCGSHKWRQEGKSKYYFCKGIEDFLDRFVLDISFKSQKKK